MRRRAFLRRSALLGAVGLAGCTADGPGGTPTATDPTPTTTASPTTTSPGIELAGSDLSLRDQSCGMQRNAAEVTFASDGPTVTVEGTIWGADTCVIAELGSATYDPDADRLTVAVRPVRRETDGTQACGQCIVEIEYTVTCRFEGGLPGTVEVVHGEGDRRTTVTTADRGAA